MLRLRAVGGMAGAEPAQRRDDRVEVAQRLAQEYERAWTAAFDVVAGAMLDGAAAAELRLAA